MSSDIKVTAYRNGTHHNGQLKGKPRWCLKYVDPDTGKTKRPTATGVWKEGDARIAAAEFAVKLNAGIMTSKAKPSSWKAFKDEYTEYKESQEYADGTPKQGTNLKVEQMFGAIAKAGWEPEHLGKIDYSWVQKLVVKLKKPVQQPHRKTLTKRSAASVNFHSSPSSGGAQLGGVEEIPAGVSSVRIRKRGGKANERASAHGSRIRGDAAGNRHPSSRMPAEADASPVYRFCGCPACD